MRIENQPRGYGGAPKAVAKTGAARTGNFRQLLAAAPQEPKDTLTISHRAPAAEETPASAAVPDAAGVGKAAPQAAPSGSASGIQPGDSTQVKLAKLQQMAEEADYTGMSYAEVYSTLYNQYNDAFDGNFPAINNFCLSNEWNDIKYQFYENVRDYVRIPMLREFEAETGIRGAYFIPLTHREADRAFSQYISSKYGDFRAEALGYGNMSMEEVEQAIYEKYKGKNTLRDFLKMQGELFDTGVMMNKFGVDGSVAYRRALDGQLPRTYFFDEYIGTNPINISQNRWDAVLDGKFDAHAFAADMRESLKNMSFSGWDFDIEDAISKGIDYLLEAVERTK